ncbi:MAG TPA: two-component regulator propeller domain-containing protein [Balneolaceae bacterium]|nr:two-component regulator propeller domain-containing protein [Balneolaceae bacterium]
MQNLRFFISLIFLISLADVVFAQYLPFRSYSIELGLSESVAHTMVQDEKGFIWVGTGYGLNRFDGQRFKQYYEEDGLANNRVNSLHQDSKGRIWVGTDTGISIFENDTLFTPDYLNRFSRYSITAIFIDSNGNAWIGTDGNGIWKANEDETVESIDEKYGLPVERVRAIDEAVDGSVWLGSREGLAKISPDGEVDFFASRFGAPELRIRDLDAETPERIWIATRTGLVLFYEGEFTVYGEESGLNDQRIQSVTVEGESRIWLGTESGVSLFDGENFQNYTRNDGLPASIIYDTLKDREGNIWLGTLGGGISMYVGDYFKSFDIDNGLTNNVITGFGEDSDRNIWMATYGGGVLKYNGTEFDVFTSSDGLADNKVYSIKEDRDGRIWIGSSGGLNIYEDGKLRLFDGIDYPLESVRKVFEDEEKDEFWIATYNDGVFRYSEEGYIRYHAGNGLLNNTVMDVKKSENGDIWLATYGGVSIFDGDSFRHITIADGIPSNGVIHIYKDNINRTWLSTFNGVAILEEERIIRLPESENSEIISYFTIQDRDGRYYVGTNQGLYKVDPESLVNSTDPITRLKSFRLYNKNQGLISNELNAGGSLLASDGSIWLGSVEGVSQFFPENVRHSSIPPGIEFEEIMASGNMLHSTQHVVLDDDQNFLQFSFKGLSFEAPDQVIYEYRMRGLEQGWQLTRDSQIRYPSLSPGEYEFQVRAYNADGVPSAELSEFSFEILYPFYLRWWFLMLVSLLLMAFGFFLYRYFGIRKQVDIERMRVQIASDLHDDVGSSLTEIALQTDLLQAGPGNDEIKNTMKQLGEQSRKIVSSLDDIVWSIDSRNDTAGDLTDRMQDYVNQVLSQKDIEVHYDFDDLKMQEKLPVDVKENVYLIFKESINNIAKHSNATKVVIRFSFSGKHYQLTIHDNGTMGQNESRKSGQGLRNMRMRAERIGSDIQISENGGYKVHASGSIK